MQPKAERKRRLIKVALTLSGLLLLVTLLAAQITLPIYRRIQVTHVKATSASNLQQLYTGLRLYHADKGVVPPMQNATAASNALASVGYVKNPATFVHPVTGDLYLPNPTLSGKKTVPAGTVIYYEPLVNADGTRGVVLWDGTVQFVPNATWLTLKKASGIL